MKTSIIARFYPPTLLPCFIMMLACGTPAQTFTVLHSFTPIGHYSDATHSYDTNSDGASPVSGLAISGTTLYGTAPSGGKQISCNPSGPFCYAGFGTVFALKTDGTSFTVLHDFNFINGAHPSGPLILSGSTLYGTSGAAGSYGIVFKLNTNGSGFAVLSNPGSQYVANPSAALLLSGNTLYLASEATGSNGDGSGAVSKLNVNGTGLANVFVFNQGLGSEPECALVLSGDILYGTTSEGGNYGGGTVFRLTTDGSFCYVLHNFGTPTSSFYTNNDGAIPRAGLVLSANMLYGTTIQGGSSGNGTVFRLSTDGSGFMTLHSFTASSANSSGVYTNIDGVNPQAGLILSGTTLLGTTTYGGSSGNGSVFALQTDGSGFTNLYSFTASSTNSSGVYTNSDGANPQCDLILSGSALYGTTKAGGLYGNGTVFSLSLPIPQLAINTAGTNVILTWPKNLTAFNLESTTDLTPPVAWALVSPSPVLVKGQNTVTNPISGAQQFYRLSE